MTTNERETYEGDVLYDVWRRGGDIDAVNFDRLDDARYEGLYPEEAAIRELRIQHTYREQQRAYWAEMEGDDDD